MIHDLSHNKNTKLSKFKTNKQTKTTYVIRNNKSRKYGLLFLLAGYFTLSHIFAFSLTTHPEKTTQNIGKHSRKNTSAEKTIHIKKKIEQIEYILC